MKLIEKLWNWGHLAGSHNKITGFDCKMTPAEFGKEYGIKNSFIVSYGGNIQPPFSNISNDFASLNKIVWSVLGDGSTPLPEHELGNTPDILDIVDTTPNLVGGVVDDFFSPHRMERFTPDVLKKIKESLNSKGLSFWCVLYDSQLDLDLEKYMECFDGVTFWIWKSENITNIDEYFEKLKKIITGKPVMLGVYLMDYSGSVKQMESSLFEMQLKRYIEHLKNKEIDGIVFCSNTVGDAPLETNKILKEYIAKYGDTEI